MNTLSLNQAQEEFNNWLDFKHIRAKKKESNEQFEEIIVEALEYGLIKIDDKFNMIYELTEPIKDDEGNEILSSLKFVPRIRVAEMNKRLKGVKSDDADGRITAYVSALTGQNSGIIGKLYSEDYSVCQAIVMYFL